MKKEPFFHTSPSTAYLAAVNAASLTYTLIFVAFASTHGFESATNNSLETKVTHLSIMALSFFIIGWIFTFTTALLPFTCGWIIANKLRSRHWLFFVIGGIITSALLAPISASIPDLGINVQGPIPSLLEKTLHIMPIFSICGAAAGIVCWLTIRNKRQLN